MSLWSSKKDRMSQMCKKCGQELPLCEFSFTTTTGANGGPDAPQYRYIRRDCKKCRAKASRSKSIALRREGNPARPPLGTPCQLCGDTTKRLCFDHCMLTDTFRAWLCNACNSGVMRCNLDELRRAYEFQKKHLARHNALADGGAVLIDADEEDMAHVPPLALPLTLGK